MENFDIITNISNFRKVRVIILKNKGTILFLLCALAGIALGVFFLIYGLKMDLDWYDGYAFFMETSRTLYIILGSIFAFLCTCVAALTMVKLAKEEEENKPNE